MSRNRSESDNLDHWTGKCYKTWFERFESTAAMKKEGSLNEDPTFAKFKRETYVLEAFDVGLLESKDYPYLGVSPDDVACILTPGINDEGNFIAACMEIKTRVADSTISKIEEARNNHGSPVFCEYGDDKFEACVFPEHRGQVIHQAAIAGFDHGVYISAKVEEEMGFIVQIVIFKIPCIYIH